VEGLEGLHWAALFVVCLLTAIGVGSDAKKAASFYVEGVDSIDQNRDETKIATRSNERKRECDAEKS
jgi:hypothetical protein